MVERVNDPTLPAGWQALFDPASGLRYYWNQAQNITQYDRPAGDAAPPAQAPPPVASSRPDSYSNGHGYAAGGGQGSYQDYGRDRDHRDHHKEVHASSSHAQVNDYGQATLASHRSNAAFPMSYEEYKRAHDLRCEGDNIPPAFQTFESVGFPPDILDEIYRAGFKSPTPIQSQAWSIALTGRDMVAIAKTGSGKTCGFLLPGLLHIKASNKDPRNGPTILVLAPTRELAVQIKTEADKFGRSSGIRNTCVYGGAPKHSQLRDIQYGVHIVIATPGRLNDFLESGQVRLGQVSYLVLDEADRMLDMGFEPQIQKIVRALPRQRQTLFFSATWPREVKAIASQFVVNRTVHVFIGGVEERLVANKSITQHVEVIEQHEKMSKLFQILRSKPPTDRIIIFCTTKRMCDELSRILQRDFRSAAMHGDKKQSERDYILQSFKDGRAPVLIATDVAARGLDIPNVTAVINYDFPNGVEDYVHRIGRTGRAGKTGESYTFMTSKDANKARELITLLREAGQVVPPALEQLSSRGGFGGGGRGSRWGSGPSSFGGGGSSFGGGSSYGGSAMGRSSYAAPAAYVAPVAAALSYDRDRGRDRSRSPAGRDRHSSRRSRSRSRSRRSPSPRHRSRRSPSYDKYR